MSERKKTGGKGQAGRAKKRAGGLVEKQVGGGPGGQANSQAEGRATEQQAKMQTRKKAKTQTKKSQAADNFGGNKAAGRKSSEASSAGKDNAGNKKGEPMLKINQNSVSVKTEKGSLRKGKSKSKAGSVRSSGKGPTEVDTRAIKRMLSWQLELLDRLRVLTLSALEVVQEGRPE